MVRDAAMMYARQVSKTKPSLYEDMYRCASESNNTWPAVCKALLIEWSISPWEHWQGGDNLHKYRCYVTETLSTACQNTARNVAKRHSAEIPYLSFTSTLGGILHDRLLNTLPWDVQMGLRSWCRLRAGYVMLYKRHNSCNCCIFLRSWCTQLLRTRFGSLPALGTYP